jgi:hypothetical protein
MKFTNVLTIGMLLLTLTLTGCRPEAPTPSDSGEIHMEPDFIAASDETFDAILKIHHVGHYAAEGTVMEGTTAKVSAMEEIIAEVPLEFVHKENAVAGLGIGTHEITSYDPNTDCTTYGIQEIRFHVDGSMGKDCLLELMIGEERLAGETTVTCPTMTNTGPLPGVTIPGKMQKIAFEIGKHEQEGKMLDWHWIYTFEIIDYKELPEFQGCTFKP